MTDLRLQGIGFRYMRGRPVLEDLNLDFPSGSTLLLGPNGAGKSTVLGLASSALVPQVGSVSIGTLVASRTTRKRFRATVGWMPQKVETLPGVTVREQVAYAGWLKGLSKHEAWAKSLEALERVGLGGYERRRPSQLSGGELRRLGVSQVLVHEADWVLMDEPTAGLDPLQRQRFYDLTNQLGDGVSVVVSTHQTEDITARYDWVVVLDAGKVRFAGPVRDFLRLGGNHQAPHAQVVHAYQQALTSS